MSFCFCCLLKYCNHRLIFWETKLRLLFFPRLPYIQLDLRYSLSFPFSFFLMYSLFHIFFFYFSSLFSSFSSLHYSFNFLSSKLIYYVPPTTKEKKKKKIKNATK